MSSTKKGELRKKRSWFWYLWFLLLWLHCGLFCWDIQPPGEIGEERGGILGEVLFLLWIILWLIHLWGGQRMFRKYSSLSRWQRDGWSPGESRGAWYIVNLPRQRPLRDQPCKWLLFAFVCVCNLEWSPSCAIPMAWWICLPFRKPNCSSEIFLLSVSFDSVGYDFCYDFVDAVA